MTETITMADAKAIIENQIEELARRNKEPEWMTKIRYKGLETFEKAPPHRDPPS